MLFREEPPKFSFGNTQSSTMAMITTHRDGMAIDEGGEHEWVPTIMPQTSLLAKHGNKFAHQVSSKFVGS